MIAYGQTSEYFDRNSRERAWRIIGEEFHDDWEVMDFFKFSPSQTTILCIIHMPSITRANHFTI